MAPQAETGKSGWLKLATALYYCLASMTVQYMNKVRCCERLLVERSPWHMYSLAWIASNHGAGPR